MRASHLALGCAVATLCLVHTAADTPAGHGAVLVDTRGRGDKGAREAEFVAFKAKHSKTYGSAGEPPTTPLPLPPPLQSPPTTSVRYTPLRAYGQLFILRRLSETEGLEVSLCVCVCGGGGVYVGVLFMTGHLNRSCLNAANTPSPRANACKSN
jgi:hypothetical protein